MQGSQSSDDLLSDATSKDHPSVRTKSTKKRKLADPTYVPVKAEYSSDDDDHEVPFGLQTPKRTPQKRQARSDFDGNPRPKKKPSHHTPNSSKKAVLVTPSSYKGPSGISSTLQTTFNPLEVLPGPAFYPPQLDDKFSVKNTRHASLESANESYSPLSSPSDSGATTENGSLSPQDLVNSKRRKSEHDMHAFVPDHSDEDNDDSPTFRVSKNEKTTLVFDFSLEKAKRWAEAINLPQGFYNPEESDLFFRLAMRGFEPLVPRHWKHDFPTLPELLFPPPGDESGPLIRAFGKSDFFGVKSLTHLFSLGGRVRDCNVTRIKPEPLIKRCVVKYIRWAFRDAKIHIARHSILVHAIYDQKKGESTLSAVKNLNQRLQRLASRYRRSLNSASAGAPPSPQTSEGSGSASGISESHPKYPLLTGFVICGPIITILSLSTDPSSAAQGSDSKFISQFDLSERGQDVWNSLAIAITVMHIRRTMMQLAEESLGGFSHVQRDASPTSDADI
ncbi:predicted protein [Aspergillus terreus NIH2624]|uniref:Uncharacterized protein n=1 Tax=Aspergillus terreus (strain NIH 2624 / FGSC A1156) TaxID=341663 RepID=Q0CW55_ASPTN|nr:uncharacterized protein ATEG_02079 [Aspergillus terreus NIH2624]EAU37041.1 predicted protein [Aspergillus terreus NIH2624]